MRRLKAYKKTVSIVNESAIELYKGLGREKKGFLMESNDKENGRYTFMGVDPQEVIQSDKDSLVITKSDGSREVRKGNPLVRLKEYFDEFEIIKDAENKSVVMLTWNGTDSDLIELVAALMAAGAISSKNGDKLTVISVIRAFEDMFHLKINALYTKRGKVFDRCTDTTPFIDSLRVSYNRMLEKRLI